jgi:ketosteroid isomerase-like protein
MMKMKNLQGIICLLIIFLFTNQAWAADWILYASTSAGYHYYDKSSIKKVNESIVSVKAINVFNKDGKSWAYSFLKNIGKAPDMPDVLTSMMVLAEYNCANDTFRFSSGSIYYEKGKFFASLPKSIDKWGNVIPNSHIKTLKNIVCQEHFASKEVVVAPNIEEPFAPNEVAVAPKVKEPVVPKAAVVAPKVEEPVASKVAAIAPTVKEPAPKEIVVSKVEEPVAPNEVVVAAPAVTGKNLAQANSKQNKIKYVPEKAVRNLITKWLDSWKSGDMKTYSSCYASDFMSKEMNLDAWVAHKTNVYQKNKNINISIDKLQISADENFATAVFTQFYSSSVFKYSGKKKLELKKINDEWKIYREIM